MKCRLVHGNLSHGDAYWSDNVKSLRLTLGVPPTFIINVDNEKCFHALRNVARGAIDMEKSSETSAKLYASELLSYSKSICYCLDVMFEVILWRGRVQLTTRRTVYFPIHFFGWYQSTTI